MQQRFCPAGSVCGVCHTFGDTVARSSHMWGEVCRTGDTHCPGWGHPVSMLWCAAAPLHGHTGPVPALVPSSSARSLISPGARSRCADALFPAPNSQPPALTSAFLGQLREGRSSQDCLRSGVNVTLPRALLPARSWPWMHRH